MRGPGLGLILTACVVSAWAQGPAQAPATPQTSQVLINLQATDKAGHPIPGLKQTDFSVFDNGQPVPIRLFAALPGSDEKVASILLLIDSVNADVTEVTFARQQIAKFLRSYGQHLPAAVSISVVTEFGIHQLLQPDTDGTKMAWELEQSEAHLRPVPPTADWGETERWQDSIQALGKIANYQLQRPGRTVVIWVGPGWSIFSNPGLMINDKEQAIWMRMIVGMMTGLREARITLDVVDPWGMQDGAAMEEREWGVFVKPVKKQSDAYPIELSLQILATNSGGRVLYSSNDVAGELSACAEDVTAWYAMRIDRQKSDQPNTWHDVEIRVDQPGVVVRAIKGYYAQP